ncbi:MAG: hypothetical protein E6J55_22660 [Deltaproteobacteria bacterium]|nr:MAG: hypothetical protein E6J55_22660 [Deltaproteobacteria bacterium]
MPTIEPSGWSGASVRLRRGDCKLDDARRLALLSSREWGPASRSRSFPRGTDETSRRPRTRTCGGWSRGCGGGSSAWGWRASPSPTRTLIRWRTSRRRWPGCRKPRCWAGRRWAAGPGAARCGSAPTRTRRGSSATTDRGIERLCQYLFRPPLGQQRWQRLRDGRIAVALQRPWADGTTHLVFTPDELLERLVPLVPRPRINLLLCHGVLAPNAPWRQAVVVRGGEGSTAAPANAGPCATPVEDLASDKAKPGRARPKYRAWAELMHRAFEADVLACPRCGGRMVVLATIEDPAVIRRILTHLGASMEPGEALPAARASPWTDSPARLSLLQAHRAARKRRQRLGHGAEGQSRDARGDVEG